MPILGNRLSRRNAAGTFTSIQAISPDVKNFTLGILIKKHGLLTSAVHELKVFYLSHNAFLFPFSCKADFTKPSILFTEWKIFGEWFFYTKWNFSDRTKFTNGIEIFFLQTNNFIWKKQKILGKNMLTWKVPREKVPPWWFPPGKLPPKKIPTQDKSHLDHSHSTQKNSHPGKLAPGKIPPGKFPPR